VMLVRAVAVVVMTVRCGSFAERRKLLDV